MRSVTRFTYWLAVTRASSTRGGLCGLGGGRIERVVDVGCYALRVVANARARIVFGHRRVDKGGKLAGRLVAGQRMGIAIDGPLPCRAVASRALLAVDFAARTCLRLGFGRFSRRVGRKSDSDGQAEKGRQGKRAMHDQLGGSGGAGKSVALRWYWCAVRAGLHYTPDLAKAIVVN